MRRAKVKVHQAEPSKIEVQDEEPEIEYMPPQPKREWQEHLITLA